MRKHLAFISRLALLLLVDVMFFGFINPSSAYAAVLIIGFALLVVNIYVIAGLVLSLLARLLPLGDGLHKRLQASITLFAGIIIAMQSIGQLTGKDMFAIVPLALLLAFYLYYQKKLPSR